MIPSHTQGRRIRWIQLRCSRPFHQPIPESTDYVTGISSAPKLLAELRLGSNYFDGKFPSEILKLDRLKKLHILHNTGISDNVLYDIGKMTGLMELEPSFTSLHGNIPSEFGLLKDLCYLSMDETHIHGHIPVKLENMQHIKYLSIESSQPNTRF